MRRSAAESPRSDRRTPYYPRTYLRGTVPLRGYNGIPGEKPYIYGEPHGKGGTFSKKNGPLQGAQGHIGVFSRGTMEKRGMRKKNA